MSINLFHKKPKCLEDKVYTELKPFSIITSNGKKFASVFSYCKKCKQYVTKYGMEKDIKKVALNFVQIFNHSYGLYDIIEVNEFKDPKKYPL